MKFVVVNYSFNNKYFIYVKNCKTALLHKGTYFLKIYRIISKTVFWHLKIMSWKLNNSTIISKKYA